MRESVARRSTAAAFDILGVRMIASRLSALPVYFTPAMVADSHSYSPSALKPLRAMESWKRLGIPLDVRVPRAATLAALHRAHDPAYVDAVLSLRHDNGFGNRNAEVAASLPYTSGAMLDAARCAIGNRRVAVAPVSGFHHARYDEGGGFCTFNGLVVAALALLDDGLARRVGILDCDHHFGDGTADIILALDLGEVIRHDTVGRHEFHEQHAEPFLESLGRRVGAFADCDVLLYQAGADPHIDDPLGGWLTTAQLVRRDRIVLEAAAIIGLPVAWNLAGGYQEPFRRVLDIHDNTLRECWRVHGSAA
jgi:acetoin utilization deacetylase AcuC-like enzyme